VGATFEVRLAGPGGEPVDLWRTIVSHGVASLPPMLVDEDARTLEVTLPLPRARPRTIVIQAGRPGFAAVTVVGRRPGREAGERIEGAVRHTLNLDQDLSGFYEAAAADPDLAWATSGAGRMIRSASVFEEVVKTVCTTNCTWSATERMVGALVEHLGESATGAPEDGARGRAFPTPEAMANAGEAFYREVARAGYRGAYLVALARSVGEGSTDLEVLGRASPEDMADSEVESSLLELPGVGPYAAAHIMMMLGRFSKLVLDSWTRPTYAKLIGRGTVNDAAIQRRFRRYGPYAGLAFWLFLTRDWVREPPPEAA
jgi:3-methyladenine DNA glycosylase/8-oxoguanine DNA glycosylase